MKMMLATLFAMSLLVGLVGEAGAASERQRGYKAYGPAARTARPAPLQSPRGYRPARKSGREYDFPRFGSKRWWQLQEDMD
jgi:hypothetical protein